MTLQTRIRQQSWHHYARKVFWISLPIVAGLMICGTGVLLYLSYIFDGIGELGLPIQDCMALPVDIGGVIRTSDGTPVSSAQVIARYDHSDFDPTKRIAETNPDGIFLIDDLMVYACYSFTVEIIWEGYKPELLEFYMPNFVAEYCCDHRDVLRRLNITLEPIG